MHPEVMPAASVPRGVWLGASTRLGYPVPTDQPHPHTCGTDALHQAMRRDCVACAEARQKTPDQY